MTSSSRSILNVEKEPDILEPAAMIPSDWSARYALVSGRDMYVSHYYDIINVYDYNSKAVTHTFSFPTNIWVSNQEVMRSKYLLPESFILSTLKDKVENISDAELFFYRAVVLDEEFINTYVSSKYCFTLGDDKFGILKCIVSQDNTINAIEIHIFQQVLDEDDTYKIRLLQNALLSDKQDVIKILSNALRACEINFFSVDRETLAISITKSLNGMSEQKPATLYICKYTNFNNRINFSEPALVDLPSFLR